MKVKGQVQNKDESFKPNKNKNFKKNKGKKLDDQKLKDAASNINNLKALNNKPQNKGPQNKQMNKGKQMKNMTPTSPKPQNMQNKGKGPHNQPAPTTPDNKSPRNKRRRNRKHSDESSPSKQVNGKPMANSNKPNQKVGTPDQSSNKGGLKRKNDSSQTPPQKKAKTVNAPNKNVRNTAIIFPKGLKSYNDVLSKIMTFTSMHLAPERITLEFPSAEQSNDVHKILSELLPQYKGIQMRKSERNFNLYMYCGSTLDEDFIKKTFNPDSVHKIKKGIVVLEFKTKEAADVASKQSKSLNKDPYKLFEIMSECRTHRQQVLDSQKKDVKASPGQKVATSKSNEVNKSPKSQKKEQSKKNKAQIKTELAEKKAVDDDDEEEDEDSDLEIDEEDDDDDDEIDFPSFKGLQMDEEDDDEEEEEDDEEE